MGFFSRHSTDELRAEAKQAQTNVESATRMQAAFGATAPTGEDNALSNYQRTLDQVNQELQRRS
jgi:multidrug resistance efflux pump